MIFDCLAANDIYGFDILRDMVYDVMHTMSFKMLKTYVILLVERMIVVSQIDELENALIIVIKHKPRDLGGK